MSGENPVGSYSFACGCKILGVSPVVDRMILCRRHRVIAAQMVNYAPRSAEKVLDWEANWEGTTR